MRLFFQILLPVLCVFWVGFIVGNSLKTGEESSAQSSAVVETVQSVAQVIAPDSKIATATGDDYAALHHAVRKMAHFTEYAVWGVLLCGCYFAYTDKRKWLWLPALGLLALPICDELLQTSVSGRAGVFTDVLIDVTGGVFGYVAAWGALLLTWSIIKRRKICKNQV